MAPTLDASRVLPRLLGIGSLAVVTTLLLPGCGILGPGPSPRSTYTDDAGREVVVDWADYPAHAGTDGDAVLAAPDQAGIEQPTREALALVRTAITEASGADLRSTDPEASWFGDDHWFPQSGNGYGGESMLTTVNCCALQSTGVPPTDRWSTVLDAAAQATAEAGLGELVDDRDLMEGDQLAEHEAKYCTLPDGGCWFVSATAFDGYQWLFVTIQDTSLDPTGEGRREAEEFGWPIASISVGYGATVVREGMSAAYAEAIAPFRGLERPEGTTSD